MAKTQGRGHRGVRVDLASRSLDWQIASDLRRASLYHKEDWSRHNAERIAEISCQILVVDWMARTVPGWMERSVFEKVICVAPTDTLLQWGIWQGRWEGMCKSALAALEENKMALDERSAYILGAFYEIELAITSRSQLAIGNKTLRDILRVGNPEALQGAELDPGEAFRAIEAKAIQWLERDNQLSELVRPETQRMVMPLAPLALKHTRAAGERRRAKELIWLLNGGGTAKLFSNTHFSEDVFRAMATERVEQISSGNTSSLVALPWEKTFYRAGADRGWRIRDADIGTLRDLAVKVASATLFKAELDIVSMFPDAVNEPLVLSAILARPDNKESMLGAVAGARGEAWSAVVNAALGLEGSQGWTTRLAGAIRDTKERNIAGLKRRHLLPIIGHREAEIREAGICLASRMETEAQKNS